MSCSDDEYLERLEAARDALYDVLIEAEPGTGIALHGSYNEITAAIAAAREPSTPTCLPPRIADFMARMNGREEAQLDRGVDERTVRHDPAAWRLTPAWKRDRIVLDALSDQRLSFHELFHRAHKTGGVWFGDVSMRQILSRLLAAGELDRVEERPAAGGRRRWVYFRKTELSGPIVDLDREFDLERAFNA